MKLQNLRLFALLSLVGHLEGSPLENRPLVDLGYAQYEGTTLNTGVNQFLGMRYAAPP